MMQRIGTLLLAILLGACGQFAACQSIDMEMIDKVSGDGIRARLQFTKGEKTAGLPRQLLTQGKWVLAEPSFSVSPKPGDFEFLVQRGPEFTDIRGGFTMEKGARDVVSVEVPHATKMHDENWYSGDHDSNLSVDALVRWQVADAVDFAVTHANMTKDEAKGSATRVPRSKPKKDEEGVVLSEEPSVIGLKMTTQSILLHPEHGATLLHAVKGTHPLDDGKRDLSTLIERLETDPFSNQVAELIQPWGRDVPILLATESIQAVQVLNAFLLPEGDAKLVWDRPNQSGPLGRIQTVFGKNNFMSFVFSPIADSDRIRFPSERGVGLLSEYLYWTMLEAGQRIVPTAGSGFGRVNTHLGYNRTYVYCESSPEQENYWHAVLQGRTMVTNGPLLRVKINELPPGSSFQSVSGEPIELSIAASLAVRDPVDYLDVIFNGETLYSAKLEEHYQRGEFPSIAIDKSGWLVVRVVTARNNVYRIASTAPFYFQFDNKPRISRRAVEFFREWLMQSTKAVRSPGEDQIEYDKHVKNALIYWNAQLDLSNTP